MTAAANASIKLAVVGHTNTGKTSLLRTITRNVEFGEVSPHPATTRHVEGTSVLLDGRKVMELFDTPGLEDSIGLLDHLDEIAGQRRVEGIEVIHKFLKGKSARRRFAQEAKALRQVLDCDAALYVIDARDRVLGKHRDELEILARCATPVVPVLNFTAHPDAKVALWRDQLARANMHVVAEFDTVVLDEASEQRLYEKMRTVLDAHTAVLDELVEDRRRLRASLLRASADLTADMLIDVAGLVVRVPVDDTQALEDGVDDLRQRVRDREQECVSQLLALHQFRPDDYQPDGFPLSEGQWGLDLFSPEALRQFGIKAGGAAAAGALVGLTLDAMAGGASLGAGAAAGAAVGALFGAGRMHGRRLLERMRGTTELRCDDATLRLLAMRQIALTRALLHRGHAAVTPVTQPAAGRISEALKSVKPLPHALQQAKLRPDWSRIARTGRPPGSGRAAAKSALAAAIRPALSHPPDAPVEFR